MKLRLREEPDGAWVVEKLSIFGWKKVVVNGVFRWQTKDEATDVARRMRSKPISV